MPSFTQLERAALREICYQQSVLRAALKAQLATARVRNRENTGAGFITYMSVDPATGPIARIERVLGNVTAQIEGFNAPLILLLFMKDGYVHFLEGATCADTTVGIDLTNVVFAIQR